MKRLALVLAAFSLLLSGCLELDPGCCLVPVGKGALVEVCE